MRFAFITILICLVFSTSNAELLKPEPSIKPSEVISIQLTALQTNSTPFENAGIAQTWEFAHPNNKEYTGPFKNFTKMMYSSSYQIMLDHQSHNITLVAEEEDMAFFFIELTDRIGNEYGFQWTLQKVLTDGQFYDCWMTIGVSRPISLAQST
tara:strand:+ start:25 stop:483 length:459 start_codon:yes stop_codon:yes gene_type:complete